MPELIIDKASSHAPVAVGGIGGSGTRLIARMLRRLGYYMGGDLNEASDNLWFTLLFKRAELFAARNGQTDFDQAVDVFRALMCESVPLTSDQKIFVRSLAVMDRPQHSAAWLRQRVGSLLSAAREERPPLAWGWKEPNTHVFLDRLESAFPGMRYVHVMRNGLDMAYSRNQNQLGLWGPNFFGGQEFNITPRWSLKYWCYVHRRIARLGEQLMPERFMLLNYDEFCAAPRAGVKAFLHFLGLAVDPSIQASLTALVRRQPSSTRRFSQHGLQPFDPEDVACVASFGFDTMVDGPKPDTQ
ncbi:MAG: sulfotransferase family protein [Gammaproteobacteria bacterium]